MGRCSGLRRQHFIDRRILQFGSRHNIWSRVLLFSQIFTAESAFAVHNCRTLSLSLSLSVCLSVCSLVIDACANLWWQCFFSPDFDRCNWRALIGRDEKQTRLGQIGGMEKLQLGFGDKLLCSIASGRALVSSSLKNILRAPLYAGRKTDKMTNILKHSNRNFFICIHCNELSGVAKNGTKFNATTTLQRSVIKWRGFHQNVQKLIGNTTQTTVPIFHLNVLRLAAGKWTTSKSSIPKTFSRKSTTKFKQQTWQN